MNRKQEIMVIQLMPSTFRTLILALLIPFFLAVGNIAKAELSSSISQIGKDLAATCHVRKQLKNDRRIEHKNFSILVKDGVINLFGNAKNVAEKNLVISYAQETKFAIKIVTYIEISEKKLPKEDGVVLAITEYCNAQERGSEKEINEAVDRIFAAADASKNIGSSASKSNPLSEAKKECASIGYKPATEKYADCVMKLMN